MVGTNEIESLALEVIANPSKESKFMNAVNSIVTHMGISDTNAYINAVNKALTIAERKGYLTFNDFCNVCNVSSFLYGDLFGWRDITRFFYSVRIAEDFNTGSFIVKLPKKEFLKEEVEPVKRYLIRSGLYKRS